jgi:hypothetical protein
MTDGQVFVSVIQLPVCWCGVSTLTGLSFTIVAGPRQRSHSQIRVPRDSWPHVTVSDSRLPPTWRARSPYLYPPGTGWPGYTPGTGFPFRRLLRLAGLRWRYSNPPPHGRNDYSQSRLLYNWWFTANQFVLAPSPLRFTTRFFFQRNPCCHSPYVTASLTRRWVCLLRICLAFRQVYVSHIQHVIENSSFCITQVLC